MKNKKSLTIILFILLLGCDRSERFSLTEITPVVLSKNGKEIFQYWEFPNENKLWGFDIGQVENIKLYQDTLLKTLGVEQYKKAISKQENITVSLNKEVIIPNGDVENFELVHNGLAGKIRKINVLEAELLNYQMNEYPLFSHPTEFHGFIAIQDSLDLIRVYFCSSDKPWPPKPQIIISELKSESNNGWRLKYHLHNHFEPDSNNYIGILAPSMADAEYFKMLYENFEVEKTLITNGFNTVEFKNEEFNLFESH